ncbi:MAG: hypothetical protein IPF54_08880 [Draconibacterium sp.]|nr:hypothetical protein [Draconibacterium sp.]
MKLFLEFVIPNDGKDLYAATFNNLVHYKIDQQKSDLQFVESITSDGNTGNGLPGFKKIIASNDNKNIYVFSSSMFTTSGISVYKRDNDGNLELVEKLLNTDYPFMVESPFSLALSPDDKYLYAAGTSILF